MALKKKKKAPPKKAKRAAPPPKKEDKKPVPTEIPKGTASKLAALEAEVKRLHSELGWFRQQLKKLGG